MSEEEKKAIDQLKYELEIPNSIPLYWAIDIVVKLVDKLKNNLYEEQEQNEYLKDKVEKQQKEIEEAKKYITSLDFFNLLCPEERKKDYFIAHDKLLDILGE